MSFGEENEHTVNDVIDSTFGTLASSEQDRIMKEATRIVSEYRAHLKGEVLDERSLYETNGLYA